jgi:hypothetical protein
MRGTAKNRVELRCVDSTITVTINGTQVATARDTTYRAGRMWIGANVEPGAVAFGHVLFDNMLIRGIPAPVASQDQRSSPAQPPANVSSEPN